MDTFYGKIAHAGNVRYKCPTFHPYLQVFDEDVLIHTTEFADAMTSDRAHEIPGTGAGIISRQIVKTFSDEGLLKQTIEPYR